MADTNQTGQPIDIATLPLRNLAATDNLFAIDPATMTGYRIPISIASQSTPGFVVVSATIPSDYANSTLVPTFQSLKDVIGGSTGSVRYDTAQGLTTQQQQTARTNIGAEAAGALRANVAAEVSADWKFSGILQALSAPQNPTDVARKQEVDAKFDKSAGDALQATVAQIPSIYLTKADATSTYSTKSDLASVRSIAEAAQTSQQVDDKITAHNQNMGAHANLLAGYATTTDLSDVRSIAEAAQTSAQVQAAIGNHNSSTTAHENRFSLMATKSEVQTGLAGKLDKSTADGLYVAQGQSWQDIYDMGRISAITALPDEGQADSTMIPTLGAVRASYDSSVAEASALVSAHNISDTAHENRFSLMATAADLAVVKTTADSAVQPAQMTNAITNHNAASDAHTVVLDPIRATLSGKMDTATAQASFIAKGGALSDLYDSGKYSPSVAVVTSAQKTSTVIPTAGALRTTMESFQSDYQIQLSNHNTSMSAHANLVADLATKDELSLGLSTKVDVVTADNTFATKTELQEVKTTAEYATTPEEVQSMIDASGSGDGAYDKVRLTLIPEHNADPMAHSNQFGPVNTALASKLDKTTADATYQPKGSYLTTSAAASSYIPTGDLMLQDGDFADSGASIPHVWQVDDYVNKTVIPSVTASLGTLMDNKVSAHNSSADAHAQLLSAYVLTSALTPQLAAKLDVTTAASTYATQTALSQGLATKIDSTAAYAAFAGKSDLNTYVNWANVFSTFGGERPSTDSTSLLPSLKYLDAGLADMKSYVDQKIPSDPALTKDEAWTMMTGSAIPAHNTAADAHANLLNPINTSLAAKMDTTAAQTAFIGKTQAFVDLYDSGYYSEDVTLPGADQADSTVIPSRGSVRATYDAAVAQIDSKISAHNTAADAHASKFSLYQTIAGMADYQKVSDMGAYLTTASAASTYQTISGMSAYQTVSGMVDYLTHAQAAGSYQPVGPYMRALMYKTSNQFVDNLGFIRTGWLEELEYNTAVSMIPSAQYVLDRISMIPDSSLLTDEGTIYQGGRITNLWNNEVLDLSCIPSTRSVQAAITAEVVGTYQRVDGMSAYQKVSDMAAYLTSSTAASTYQTISGMSVYLKSVDAASAYQPKGDYMLTSAADAKYVPLTRILSGNIGNTGTTQLTTSAQVIDFANGSVIPAAANLVVHGYALDMTSKNLEDKTLIPWAHQVINYVGGTVVPSILNEAVPALITAHNTSMSAHANLVATLATKTELTNGLSGKLDTSTAMDTYATQVALTAVKTTADAAVQPSQMTSAISAAINTHNSAEPSHNLDIFHAAFDNIVESYIPYVDAHIVNSITSAQVDAKIAGHNTAADSHANLIGPINTSLTGKLDKTAAASTYQTISGMSAYAQVSYVDDNYLAKSWMDLSSVTLVPNFWDTTYIPSANQVNFFVSSIIPAISNVIEGSIVPDAIDAHNQSSTAHQNRFALMATKTELANYLSKTDAASTYQPKGDYMLSSRASDFVPVSRLEASYDMWRPENSGIIPQSVNIMTWYETSVIPDVTSAVNSGVTTHNNSASAHSSLFALYAKQADVTTALNLKLDIATASSTYQPKGEYALKPIWSDGGNIVEPLELTYHAKDFTTTIVPVFSAVRDWVEGTVVPDVVSITQVSIIAVVNDHNISAEAHRALFDTKISTAAADAKYQPKGSYLTLSNVDTGVAISDAKMAKTYPYTNGSVMNTLIPSVEYVQGMLSASGFVKLKEAQSGTTYSNEFIDYTNVWDSSLLGASVIPTINAVAAYVKPTTFFPSFYWQDRQNMESAIPPASGGSYIPSADAIAMLLNDMIGNPLTNDFVPVYGHMESGGGFGGWSYIPDYILTQNNQATMVPSTNLMVNTVHNMCKYWHAGETSVSNVDGGHIDLDLSVRWYDLTNITSGTTLTLNTGNAAYWNSQRPNDKRVFTWYLWLPMATLKTLVWPSNLKWLDGTAPTFEAGKAYCIALQYDLGGVLNGNVAYSRAL